ncbi:hypothetical protein C7A10_14770 [Pseudomonas fluorescens]|uniref:Uncharacterized protein n=1 Tax=Pseudomonas fluorescens TaxID=294 RepID=A0A2T0IBB5_PSEFL|nr:hypothetical protein C7A10_14770 [Pseudomonas fluorescens]
MVGASLLAKNSWTPRASRKHALSLTFFASKLAPTKKRYGREVRWRTDRLPHPYRRRASAPACSARYAG